ncbi:MAG: hypothetical protein KH111_19875 [Bacteroidales bacterium]|nr:hypothetical protein [Bacteroidales bacterium]
MKHFTYWDQPIALMSDQLSNCESLET